MSFMKLPKAGRTISDVARPELIRPRDAQISQPIGIDLVPPPGLTVAWLPIGGTEPHLLHQVLHTLPIHSISLILKHITQAPSAI